MVHIKEDLESSLQQSSQKLQDLLADLLLLNNEVLFIEHPKQIPKELLNGKFNSFANDIMKANQLQYNVIEE